MKNDDFLKRINRELDGLSLPMSKQLKEEPIAVRNPSTTCREKTSLRRRWVSIGAGALAASIALICVLVNLPSPAGTEAVARMQMDINPSVSFVLDNEGKVLRVVSLNPDGDTLISDERFVGEVVGKTAADAAKTLAERAARSGYLDLFADGNCGKYNEIQLSFEGIDGMVAEQTDGVKNSLVDFFKEKGIYVYVQTSQTEVEGGEAALKGWQQRPTSFFEYRKAQSQDTGAKDAAKEMVYDYTKDILLSSIEKYELVARIEKNDNLLSQTAGVGYWLLSDAQRESEELSGLCAETSRLLEKLYAIYGEDYREVGLVAGMISSVAFEGYCSLYVEPLADEVEMLRSYAEGEGTVAEFGAEEVIDFVTLAAASGYGVELLDGLQSLLSCLLSDAITEIESFVSSTQTFLGNWATVRMERYSSVFDMERAVIDDGAYQAFLEKIEKN